MVIIITRPSGKEGCAGLARPAWPELFMERLLCHSSFGFYSKQIALQVGATATVRLIILSRYLKSGTMDTNAVGQPGEQYHRQDSTL